PAKQQPRSDFRQVGGREDEAGGAGVDGFRQSQRQEVHGQRRSARVGDHAGQAAAGAAEQALDDRARLRLRPPAPGKPVSGEEEGRERDDDRRQPPVDRPHHQEAGANAHDDGRHQERGVRSRPRARTPIPQCNKVHGDEQRRQHRSRREGIEDQRQERDADDGKASAERAAHEGDQPDAERRDGEGQKVRHRTILRRGKNEAGCLLAEILRRQAKRLRCDEVPMLQAGRTFGMVRALLTRGIERRGRACASERTRGFASPTCALFRGNQAMGLVMWAIIGCGLLSLVYGAYTVRAVMASDAGTPRMQEIAAAIQEGAQAYLTRQYTTIAIAGVVIFLIVGSLLGWLVALGFLIGAVLSGTAGFIGMLVSVRANVRTAQASTSSLADGLSKAFRAGAVTGLLVAGLALLGVSVYYSILTAGMGLATTSRTVVDSLVAL